MNEAQFNQLINKIDILTKLVAINSLSEKPLKDQVLLLHSLGLPISEIAQILNKKMTDIGQYIYRKKIVQRKKVNKTSRK